MPTALFFSRDPGATNQLVAALETLREPDGCVPDLADFVGGCAGLTPFLLAKDYAHEVWRRAGEAPRDWAEAVPPGTRDRAAALAAWLRRVEARAVVTGTSDVDEDADRLLWRVARALGLPSHVFLDYPGNLVLRFTERDGSRVYPDFLYVPDVSFTAALDAAGIAGARVRITGPLHLRRMARLGSAVPAERLAALRAGWACWAGGKVILFASECASEMSEAGRPSRYDEIAVLRRLLDDLAASRPVGGRRWEVGATRVVVRPHPRDAADKFAWLDEAASPVPVRVSRDGRPEEAVLAADLVVGMDSALLREAAALGVPACSLIDAADRPSRGAA